MRILNLLMGRVIQENIKEITPFMALMSQQLPRGGNFMIARSFQEVHSQEWIERYIVDPTNELVVLRRVIPWEKMVKRLARFYDSKRGAMGKDLRMMIALMLLMRLRDLSDREVIKAIRENRYLQYFCNIADGELFQFVRGLLGFIRSVYKALPDDLNIQIKRRDKLLLFRLKSEVDERWSFVGKKENKPGIWFAMDPNSKQIVGFYVGDRSQKSAEKLFESLPEIYRKKAQFYTDDYDSYNGVIPKKRHHLSKGYTHHIERFNRALPQRVSRLVRKSLSFSKNLDNPMGAIKYFICHYNL